ncbi:lytic transglycosylase domain-containing protein [Planomonospora sp. ID67723]|uniref:lytic transglycosylase domain-containing protein n=1 Tax=Planomonospora sp. ID67723 TaxID=2738134 RepID=UPI0018C3E46F|nr:lytic transglycosylase domain-containing protein [Planomonospora sp. ID67723]MBG0830793.1 lytic transglycosylase domain-containing protein [Planomonospora sp. ID67723]
MSVTSPLPRLRILAAALAAVIALTAAAGAVLLVVVPTPVTETAPAARAGIPDLEELAPQAPPPARPSAAPTAPAAPVTGGSGITPTPPRLMVISQSTLPRQTKADIAGLRHVEKIDSFDGGAVTVSGVGLNLLAVDPARFRAWTPVAVAGRPEIWNALLRGEFVADSTAARRLGLVLGAYYQVDGGPRLRVAASAPIGLPGVDGLVGQETGRRLGLRPGVALLVHGPEKASGALDAGVRKLLGAGSQVVTVGAGHTAKAPAATGTGTPARPRAAGRVTVGRPGSYLELYRKSAAVCPGLSWTVLAAIGQVESSHGRNNGPSSAGAQGPMQFMPATWKAYGVDGDGDGAADIWSPYDAVPSAANYLCANGAGQGGRKLEKAVWFYNHSWSYVRKVLSIAGAYARAYP